MLTLAYASPVYRAVPAVTQWERILSIAARVIILLDLFLISPIIHAFQLPFISYISCFMFFYVSVNIFFRVAGYALWFVFEQRTALLS